MKKYNISFWDNDTISNIIVGTEKEPTIENDYYLYINDTEFINFYPCKINSVEPLNSDIHIMESLAKSIRDNAEIWKAMAESDGKVVTREMWDSGKSHIQAYLNGKWEDFE